MKLRRCSTVHFALIKIDMFLLKFKLSYSKTHQNGEERRHFNLIMRGGGAKHLA